MSASKYLERKLRNLNCMDKRRYYGSMESFGSIAETSGQQEKPRKKGGILKRIRHLSKSSTKADRVLFSRRPEPDARNEKTQLLSFMGKKHKRYSTLAESSKKTKKSVKFAEDVKNSNSTECAPKKKKSLLKRTGMLIVRTCRLMTYGAPHAPMGYIPPEFPYNTQYPTYDYRFYDFETGQYDYSHRYASTYYPGYI